MITLLLIALAAICNAVMDTIKHHWKESIFAKWWTKGYLGDFWHSRGWMNKYVEYPNYISGGIVELSHNVSSTNPGASYEFIRKKWLWGLINKPVQFCDAWHLFKSIMLLLLSSAIFLNYMEWEPFPINNPYLFAALMYPAWNCTFLLFYKKILVD